jgi:hypothetical protein
MINSRRERNGRWEIDYGPSIHPSSEIDASNPFIRKKVVLEQSTRECKICKTKFILHGEYDKDNPGHDLCDDCMLNQPRTNQDLYERSIQVEQAQMDAQPQEFLEPGERLEE